MKNKRVWMVLILIVALAGAGYFFRTNILSLIGGQTASAARAQRAGQAFDPANLPTTAIRPASEAAQVSAAGNIELSSQRPVVLQVEGNVDQVAVQVGDVVDAGDLLVALDTTDLERAEKQAELNLASAQIQLDSLKEPADAAEVASARAALASAQQNLADVKAGPSQAEIAAAQAKLASAQASYQELKDGPSDAELTQLSADLDKAQIALQQAQWAYDQVSYKGDVGSSSQAADLQSATIDYNTAKAAYEIATQPASNSDLQTALSDIQTAQDELDTLKSQPTQADVAAAEAEVASAQSTLDSLTKGPSDSDLKAAEISVQQAQLDLDAAQADLAQAQLRAPIAGAVLSVDVQEGERASAGTTAVTLADLNALEVTINVAEVDIDKIKPGQAAEITVDALPDKTFKGSVARITPSSASDSGVVNYPVTVQLTDTDLQGVRPGMTAVATLLGDEVADSWLVPTSALADRGGQAVVRILRDGQPTAIPVTKQASQGEWTMVQSADLHKGDEAIGAVSSYLNQDNTNRFGGPGGGFIVGGGRPPSGGGGRPD
jgi:HlyD family secretion protein